MGRPLSPLERQFLPAAQEIIDTPAGRAVALTICAAFALGLIWAILGQVEIVATAQGRPSPAGCSSWRSTPSAASSPRQRR